MMHQVFLQFGDVQPFLQRNTDFSVAQLLNILNNSHQLVTLKMELAAVVDVGSYFVKATYDLEGDGVLVVRCFDEILKIRAAIHTGYFPNVEAVARESYPSDLAVQKQWKDYAISCVQPGLLYFQEKFGNDMVHPVSAFKAARLFSPYKLKEIQPIAADIDSLNSIEFLSGEIEILKQELPIYLTKTANVDCNVDILEWWKGNSPYIPHWSEAAQKIFLIQPSSAAAERVFSIMKVILKQMLLKTI